MEVWEDIIQLAATILKKIKIEFRNSLLTLSTLTRFNRYLRILKIVVPQKHL